MKARLSALVTLFALALAGCEEERVVGPVICTKGDACTPPAPTTTATGPAGPTTGGGGTGGSGGAPPDPCEGVDLNAPLPSEVPAGWVRWNGFSCNVPYYLPSAEEFLPPPIEWEPCPDIDACQMMKVDWAKHGGVAAMAFDAWLDTTDPADPKLQLFRVEFGIPTASDMEMSVRTALLASVDGSVHHAILGHHHYKAGSDFKQSFFQPLMSAEGHDGVVVEGYSSLPYEGNFALLLWGEGLTPSVLNQSDIPYQYRIGRDWIVRKQGQFAGPAQVMRPDGSEVLTLTENAERSSVVVGDKVIYRADTPQGTGLYLWTKESGSTQLLSFPGSSGKSIFELEADAELVTYQVEDASTDPPKTDIFASPLPADAAGFQPHRVRSAMWGNAGGQTTRVGCGRLARNGLDPKVIRADDGHTWSVLHSERITFAEVFGLTCDEIFTFSQVWNEAHTKAIATVMRIRLDSLGPGEPGD